MKYLSQIREYIGVILAIAALVALAQVIFLSIGFEGKTPSSIIRELRAEVRKNTENDSVNSRDQYYIRELTETNTIILCVLAPDKLKYNLLLPCKRLMSERGIE